MAQLYSILSKYTLHNMTGAVGAITPHILADLLTLFQPGGADYAHHIITGTPGLSFVRPSYGPA